MTRGEQGGIFEMDGYIYWNLAEVSLYKVRYIFDMHCLFIQGHQRETVIYGSAAL